MFNILVTDDEQIVIDSLSFIINKNFADEMKVFTALSGTEAIEIVMKENIDIIFMDINMPGLSGLETVSVITKLKPNIVFVILSAFDRFLHISLNLRFSGRFSRKRARSSLIPSSTSIYIGTTLSRDPYLFSK